MKLTVESTNNGYILHHKFYDGERWVDNKWLYEEQDTAYGEKEAFVNLCYGVMDQLGILNGKHDKKRIRITLEDTPSS